MKAPTKALISTAYHEAGHAAVAIKLGVRVKRLSIISSDGAMGQVQHSPYLTGIDPAYDASAKAQRRMENLVLVCLAGPGAQRKHNAKGYRKYHGEGDYDTALDLLWRMSGSGEAVAVYLKLMEIRARDMVAGPLVWAGIEGIAKAALVHRKLSAVQVKAAYHDGIQAVMSKHGVPAIKRLPVPGGPANLFND